MWRKELRNYCAVNRHVHTIHHYSNLHHTSCQFSYWTTIWNCAFDAIHTNNLCTIPINWTVSGFPLLVARDLSRAPASIPRSMNRMLIRPSNIFRTYLLSANNKAIHILPIVCKYHSGVAIWSECTYAITLYHFCILIYASGNKDTTCRCNIS